MDGFLQFFVKFSGMEHEFVGTSGSAECISIPFSTGTGRLFHFYSNLLTQDTGGQSSDSVIGEQGFQKRQNRNSVPPYIDRISFLV